MAGQTSFQPRLELRRITYKVRPPRVAILFPPDLDWDQIDQIICSVSWYWGGDKSLLIPCDGNAIERRFWEQLLLYDPDSIHRLFASGNLSPELTCQLLNRICPFEGLGTSGPVMNWPESEYHLGTGLDIPVLLNDTDMEGPLVIHSLDDLPGYLRVHFHDKIGYLSQSQIDRLLNPPKDFVQDIKPVVVQQKPSNIILHNNSSILTPFKVCDWGQGYVAYRRSGVPLVGGIPYGVPTILIVGDSVLDYCFFHNLRVLTQNAYWLPKLPGEGSDLETKFLDHILSELVRIVANPSAVHSSLKVLICSISQSKDDLSSLRDNLSEIISKRRVRVMWSQVSDVREDEAGYMDRLKQRLEIVQDYNQIPSYYLEYIEFNNYIRYTSQFYNGKLLSELNTLLPKILRQKYPFRYNWVVEVEVDGYRLPRRRDLLEGHLKGLIQQCLCFGLADTICHPSSSDPS